MLSVIAWTIYGIHIIMICMYIGIKYNKRKYIFSAFNINMYVYFFISVISPIFLYIDKSWIALGINDASSMKQYTYLSMIINQMGIIFMLISMIYNEFYNNKVIRFLRKTPKITRKYSNFIIDGLYILTIIFWYYLVLKYNGTLPALNHNRTFALNSLVQTIYNTLNGLITAFALYYGLQLVINKKDFAKFIIACLTSVFTEDRSPIIISITIPILLIAIYRRTTKKKKKIKKANKKIIFMIIAAGSMGVVIGLVRGGQSVNIVTFLSEVLYKNTFCDIRDGAFVLYGFSNKMNNHFLLGKTYLAGMMSFIPSTLSSFRLKWSWGRFTTTYLFGMENHYGLRGGNSLESFINFGVPGVLVVGVLQGFLLANLEKFFYSTFLNKDYSINCAELFRANLILSISNSICISNGFASVYVLLIINAVIEVLSASKVGKIRIVYNKTRN